MSNEELTDEVHENLSGANGIGLDEHVARLYRKDVPRLLDALEDAKRKIAAVQGIAEQIARHVGAEYEEDRGLDALLLELRAAALSTPAQPTPKWECGKCARADELGGDDGQIPKHHRTCPLADDTPSALETAFFPGLTDQLDGLTIRKADQ